MSTYPGAITQHLTQLSRKFADYFPEDPRHGNLWILDPFSGSCFRGHGSVHCVGNELMELSADSSLKLQLTQVDFASFWTLTASQSIPLCQKSNSCCFSPPPIYVSQGFPLWLSRNQRQGTNWKQLWMLICMSASHQSQHDLISLFPRASPSVLLRVSRVFIYSWQ